MKRILSGSAPSGHLCIGNYLGALKNWVTFQEEYDCVFLIVDLHAITTQQKPSELRKQSLSFLAQYVACGIDPEKSIIIIQSQVPQHAELAWVLSTMTYMGELNRMTQFKEKSKRYNENINAGLYTYPVLMASDILLYQADLVPVGADQKQHLELTRNLAQRFNSRYSDTFTIPEPFIPKIGARIMSLQDPTKKMSKSDTDLNNVITLLDKPDIIRKKLKRAVTDSGKRILFDPEKRLGVANLMNLYSGLTGLEISAIESHFDGKMYSDLKIELSELTIDTLKPIQNEYDKIMGDRSFLNSILENGRTKANKIAAKTLRKVYKKIGFLPIQS
jgi:tryptophanyl-tRNA synthetase